jgi:hypothetical protein
VNGQRERASRAGHCQRDAPNRRRRRFPGCWPTSSRATKMGYGQPWPTLSPDSRASRYEEGSDRGAFPPRRGIRGGWWLTAGRGSKTRIERAGSPARQRVRASRAARAVTLRSRPRDRGVAIETLKVPIECRRFGGGTLRLSVTQPRLWLTTGLFSRSESNPFELSCSQLDSPAEAGSLSGAFSKP